MTLYLNTYFALETPRSTFWSTAAATVAVCSNNRDHTLPERARFCPECSAPILHEAAEEATPVMRGFAAELGVTPAVAFAELVDPECGWFWTSDKGTPVSLTIRWYSIERIKGEDPIKGLGFQLGQELYLERGVKQLTYSLTDLAPYHIALLEVAQKFKISGEPRLWLQMEASRLEPWR